MKLKTAVLFLIVGLFAFSVSAQSVTIPAILYFTADTTGLTYTEVEAGTAAANFSWNVTGLTDEYYLQMHAWVNAQWGLVGEKFEPKKSDRIVIAHPQDFGLPTYRLSVLNAQGVVVAASFLQLRYTVPDPDEAPRITAFTADLTEINANQLANDKVFVPVHWEVAGRWPEVNPVFEQVLPDGEVVSIELPRRTLWIPASGKGLVAPQTTGGQPVILQLRLEDVYTGQTLATQQLSIPVKTNAVVSDFAPESSSAGHAYPNMDNHFDLTASAAPTGSAVYDTNTPGFYFTTDHTQMVPGGELTLAWNAPNASLVWIELHDAGKSGCNKIYHDPEVVYGPYSASSSLTVPIPAVYQQGVWFNLYVDRYAPMGCIGAHPENPTMPVSRLTISVPEPTMTLQTSQSLPAFSADTAQLQTGSYESVPGEWVTLHWATEGGEVYITAPGDFELQGPLPATGELQVCPTSGGTTYTLYAGGQPGAVAGTDLFIYVSPSLQYPAYQADAQTCWSAR